jgi:hypothetical protein
MSVSIVLLIVAFILFVVSAFNVPSRIGLQSAGLACWVLAVILGSGFSLH